MFMTNEQHPPSQVGEDPALANDPNKILTMFTAILGRIHEFDGSVRNEPGTIAMLANAIAEAWLIDDHALDIDSVAPSAELSGDKRLRALAMLESHYGSERGRAQLQRDLQAAGSTINGNIFTNDPTRFAGLTTAVSEFIEQPSEDNLNEILAAVIDSLHHSRPQASSRPSELTGPELEAAKLSAAWAAHLRHDASSQHPEDDAITFLATLSAAAAVRAGVSPSADPTRIAPLWAAFVRELRAYPTETSSFLTSLAPTDKTVARWVMIYGDLLGQLPDMVRIAQLLKGPPAALYEAVEAIAARQLGRPMADRKKVQ